MPADFQAASLKYFDVKPIFNRDVQIVQFEGGSEQRMLRHEREVIEFIIRVNAISEAEMLAWKTFWDTYRGMADTFTFEWAPTATEYDVRFNSPFSPDPLAGGRLYRIPDIRLKVVHNPAS